jgi:hypothetical protein
MDKQHLQRYWDQNQTQVFMIQREKTMTLCGIGECNVSLSLLRCPESQRGQNAHVYGFGWRKLA